MLVVDDHPVFRDGLAALLDSVADIERRRRGRRRAEAVGRAAAAGGRTSSSWTSTCRGCPGVEATARIVAMPTRRRVLVLTMVDDDDTVVAALRAGARGYVLKGADRRRDRRGVRTVAAGGAVFGPGVAARVLASSTHPRGRTDDAGRAHRPRARGPRADRRGRQQRADRPGTGASVKTVQNYVSRILDKIQVTDRTQAALRARDARR